MSNFGDWIKNLIGRKQLKTGEETKIVTRTIDDITISVTEGLSGTKEIQVKAWNPSLARSIFWEIHGGINHPELAEKYHKMAISESNNLIADILEQKKNETMP